MRVKRKLGILLGACIFALTASGCKETQSKPVLEAVTLYVETTKELVVDDHFFEFATTRIKAYYSNNKSKIIPNEGVYFSLKNNGVAYNIFNPLPVSGIYELTATYNNVISNKWSFSVAPNKIYASHINMNGPDMIGVNRTGTITLDVTPFGYTEEVTFDKGDDTIATITQTSRFQFEVTGVAKGFTTFTFHAKYSETGWLSVYYTIEIGDNYVTSLDVSGPEVIMKGTTTTLTVNAEPLDFTVSVNTNYTGSVVSINKLSDTEFEITALNTGEASIKFYALSSQYMVKEIIYTIRVENERTILEQNYLQLRKIFANRTATPSSGDIKMLVIPVLFTDSDFCILESYQDTVKEDIDHTFFGDVTQTGLYSVASFYNEESAGAINITGTVGDWYHDTHEAQYYAQDTNNRTRALVLNAVDNYFDKTGDTRSDYDSDHDGYLDAVAVIYGAPNYHDYANRDSAHNYLGYGKDENDKYYDNLWAYKTYAGLTTQRSVSAPGTNNYIWASYDFMYNSATAKLHTGTYYSYGGNAAPRILDASTYTHEMGHMYGLYDYYDYSYVHRPAGGFSMQDRGLGSHDPYSMMALGWANPFIPTSTCTVTLNDFQSSRELILLTPEFNPYNSPFDEYLVLELFSPTGLNKYDVDNSRIFPNNVGLRVWHVNSILYKTTGTYFTRNVLDSGVRDLAFNNATYAANRKCPAYEVDQSYQDFSLLQLIRRDVNKDYVTPEDITNADLFVEGDDFTFTKYQNQFVRYYRDGNAKMDFGQSLGWSFVVNRINDYGTGQYSAEITLTRL